MDKQKMNFLTEAFKILPVKYFKNLVQLFTVALPWALKLDLELGRGFVAKYLKKIIVNLPRFFANSLKNSFFLKATKNCPVKTFTSQISASTFPNQTSTSS